MHSLHVQLGATNGERATTPAPATRPSASKPLPTLLSVARLAGVSPSTVSRALRGHRLLNEETVARIRRVAASIGYRANPIISDLMRRVRSRGRLHNLGTVAYLTFHDTPAAWRENSTYLEFYNGAQKRAQELGFALEPIWAREPHLHSRRLTQILKSRGITGVVVGPRPGPLATDILDWSQFSVAVLGMPLGDLPLHRAGSYHGSNMEQVLTALAARGYQRPGLALLGVQAATSERGWLAAWELHQQHLPAARRVPMLVLDTLAPEPFARWFQQHQPDVVIGLHDEFVTWMQQLGRRVPRYAGFARLSRPLDGAHPAGLHQFPAAIGGAAVDLVANQVFSSERGVPATARALLIEGKWIDGWTARPAPERCPPMEKLQSLQRK